MHGFAVVLDTCVLYPMYLRDTLLSLAEASTYRPLWSHVILEELDRNLTERVGTSRAAALVSLMAETFVDASVTGFEPLIPAMTNDEKDRHVLAAAVRSTAAAIVTYNLDDFPDHAVEPYEIHVLHPDEFLVNQWDLAPHLVAPVLHEQLDRYRNPTLDIRHLAERMEASDCPQFAQLLRTQL